MTGCLKLGGDPVLNSGNITIIRNISQDTVSKILGKYKLTEFRVEWPLKSWSRPRCSACNNQLYSAETFEQQMCWTHIHSSLVVSVEGKAKKQTVYLLCRECADAINRDRLFYKQIDDAIA